MADFDFDRVIERRNTNSYKWDAAHRHMGREDVLGMWTADMDLRCPEPLLKALALRLSHGVLGYTVRSENYRSIVRGWLERRFGWSPEEAALCVCPPGVIPAVCALIEVLTKPGEGVFAFMPNYDSLYGAAEALGRRLVTLPLKEGGSGRPGGREMDIEGFERLAAAGEFRLVLFCSPHNPVGRVWTRAELDSFAEICERYELFVISDEVHCDILRPGIAHIPMGSLPRMAERSATLMSPNKSFNVAGLMTASVIIPGRRARELYEARMSAMGMTLDSVFGTVAAETLYSDPECERWLEAVNVYLSENLEYAAEHINGRVPGVSTYVPEGTYLLWLDFSQAPLKGGSLREYVVKRCGLDLCDGIEFDPSASSFMRMNCACSRPLLKEALQRLEEGMSELFAQKSCGPEGSIYAE